MYYILNVLCSFVYYTRRMHFRVFKFSISVKVFVVKNSFSSVISFFCPYFLASRNFEKDNSKVIKQRKTFYYSNIKYKRLDKIIVKLYRTQEKIFFVDFDWKSYDWDSITVISIYHGNMRTK